MFREGRQKTGIDKIHRKWDVREHSAADDRVFKPSIYVTVLIVEKMPLRRLAEVMGQG
jgi:hypothetical protein